MQTVGINNFRLASETTINIQEDLLARLVEASQALHISHSKVIAYCLRRFIKKDSKRYSFFHLTGFQPKTCDYKTLHLRVNPVEYELFFDLRKSLKLSFSYIVRIALISYMDELLDSEKIEAKDQKVTKCDEYRLDAYKIAINETKNGRVHTFEWEEG